MKKIIEFGKIDYNRRGRKINMVDVELELKETTKGLEFSCCGNIWNGSHSDIVRGGQCLDKILDFVKTPLFIEIHGLWEKYHLNGMHVGTKKQEFSIEWARENGELKENSSYQENCEYLKSINQYEDENHGVPYKYGHGWLFEEIPDIDIEKIMKIINTNNI